MSLFLEPLSLVSPLPIFLIKRGKRLENYSSNTSLIIALRAGAVSPGDSLEFPAKRHGAGSRCKLREAEEEQEEVVQQGKSGTTSQHREAPKARRSQTNS